MAKSIQTTTHQIIIDTAAKKQPIPPKSIDLVVTSPPYPMIAMWDEVFAGQDPDIATLLKQGQGRQAFEKMHKILDRVWKEIYRVLKFGGFACINIGDAVRTLNGSFMLHANHARILTSVVKIGFTPLPAILWRKQTNAPNKFMGSGMLPAGAYVTLEHEYILVLRKGDKREFHADAAKRLRQRSALFWEERNQWFSDVWFDLKGTSQKLNQKDLRKRSGAFPFELPYRLISMYSVQGDTVLDPFLGMGTTLPAAAACGRNSIGIELDAQFLEQIADRVLSSVKMVQQRNRIRLESHLNFITERIQSGKPIKHRNVYYDFPVITAQEKNLILPEVAGIELLEKNCFEATYQDRPYSDFCGYGNENPTDREKASKPVKPKSPKRRKPIQLELL